MYLLCILIKLCKLFKLNQWIFQSNFENNHSKCRLKCKQIGCPYFLIWTPNFICVLVKKRIVLNLYSASILPTPSKAFVSFNPTFKALYYYFTDIVNDQNRYSEQSIRNMINDYAKRNGISLHITPHMFRHTFATALMEENVNIRYIQQLLGHSSITTTQIYTHISTNKIRHILEENHPRNKMNI